MELCDETEMIKDPRMGFFASLIIGHLDYSIAPILGQNSTHIWQYYKASW